MTDTPRKKRPGRPVKYGKTTMLRVPRTLHHKMLKALWPWEKMADFTRSACRKELQSRKGIPS